MWSVCPAGALPWVGVEQMRAVDREAIAVGLTLERMMENAGANLAALAIARLAGDARGRRITVLAGPGGNGGGGLVAARRLTGFGADVEVRVAASDERFAPVPREQLDILRAMGVPVVLGADGVEGRELVIDALLGYSQRGHPRGTTAELIAATRGLPAISLDVPSGLSLEETTLYDPVVTAEATLTIALPKLGLRAARASVGRLYLADISIPRVVFERLGIDYATPFSGGPIVALDW